MSAQQFYMGALSVEQEEWAVDLINSTASHEAWKPTTHTMSQKDFNSIIRHPSVVAQSDKMKGKKSGPSVSFTIPGGYVASGDGVSMYWVKEFNILNRKDHTLVLHWHSTMKEIVHDKRAEVASSDEKDDDNIVALVVPAGSSSPAQSAPNLTTPIQTVSANQSPTLAEAETPGVALREEHSDEPVVTDRERALRARYEETQNRLKNQVEKMEAFFSRNQ